MVQAGCSNVVIPLVNMQLDPQNCLKKLLSKHPKYSAKDDF